MIDPITGPFDHPQQTPPAPMFSYKCDFCTDGIFIDPNDPDPCDCPCHEGIASVRSYGASGDLSHDDVEAMVAAIQKGQGYCESCRQSHTCVICSGTGEV